MKKRICLVRHATAESAAPMFKDYERELTSEGYIEAARMASFLRTTSGKTDRMVSSSAFRAKQTAQVFAEQFGYDWDSAVLDDDLYDCGVRAYIKAVASTPETVDQLWLFGHNPDISYFAEYLTRGFSGSMDKASVCIIDFDNVDWEAIGNRMGTLQHYYNVRDLPR